MADLIAALSTPQGRGAIGILRLTGDGAVETVSRVFRPLYGKSLSETPDRKLVLGELLSPEGKTLDQCLAAVSRAPHSYTGEDMVELHCHGGPVLLSEGLRTLFAQGARQALGGEFTKRAFLNGKLDLMQAEAVADLIDARTAGAAVNAAGQLAGAMSRRIEEVYNGLVDLMAHFHAVLDYPDEDLNPFTIEKTEHDLLHWRERLEELLATFSRGRLLIDGVRCAIIGRPNAGKSSLLNALAGFERAIVTDIPGTTRDTVETEITSGGLVLRLVDTAGLRETADPVEELGVRRSLEAATGADLVVALFDGTRDWSDEDQLVLEAARKAEQSLLVLSKCDLEQRMEHPCLSGALRISSRTGEGLEALLNTITVRFPQGSDTAAGELLTNARQADAAARAKRGLDQALDALRQGFTPDAVLVGAEDALDALGELDGRTVREDVTARIFSRFCVGK